MRSALLRAKPIDGGGAPAKRRHLSSSSLLMVQDKLSIIIPTLNAGGSLRACLSTLAPAAMDGLVSEVIIADGGSTDETPLLADAFGARLVSGAPGRGRQLAQGADAARGPWLLFLHADTRLETSWPAAVRQTIAKGPEQAGVFHLAFDDHGAAPALVAWGAVMRSKVFRAPYGDQGLLIHRTAYDAIGGYAAMPLFEDVDIIRRFVSRYGRQSLRLLSPKALTSASRYRRDGYAARVLRNFYCLTLYQFGVAPEKIKAIYEGGS